MAGVVTTIDLEKAARNAKYVLDSATGKRKSYLSANFEITQKEKEQASPADLVNTATKLFFASYDPQKLKSAKAIFTHLTQMAPSDDVAARVKQVTPVLEKARLKEIPRQLSMMLQIKEFLGVVFDNVETAFPAARAMKFRDEHTVTKALDQQKRYGEVVLKQAPSSAELLQLLSTTEGLAFALRFPMILGGKGFLDVEAITRDEQQLLKRFISRTSDLCSPFAAKLYWCIEYATILNTYWDAYNRMSALPAAGAFMQPNTLFNSTKIKNPYFEPTSPDFFSKSLPSFSTLADFLKKLINDLKRLDLGNRPLLLKFYDLCKAVNAEIGDLNSHYRALYDEFNALNTQDGVPGPALSRSCLPSLRLTADAPLVFPTLPTPDEYAAIRSLSDIDLSPSFPPLPVFKPATPAALAVASLLSTTEEKVRMEVKESVRHETKEEQQPARPSPFANRTFAFSQKAQRVLEWESDPKTPLAGESYRTLPPELQKEQTWRHGCSALDPFVGTEYSRKGEWTNNRGEKQTAYFIQAEVECQGKTTRCVFQYAFDKDKVLYHRYAGERSNIQIVDDLLAKNRYQNDFPTLDKSFELFKTKPATVKVDVPGETLYSIDPLDVITVKDAKYDLIIRIFKQG